MFESIIVFRESVYMNYHLKTVSILILCVFVFLLDCIDFILMRRIYFSAKKFVTEKTLAFLLCYIII